MGQFGPVAPGEKRSGSWRVTGTYAAGALVSSWLFVLVLNSMVGAPVSAALGERSSTLAALVLTSALLLVDAVRAWSGRRSSFGLSRQTPYEWRFKGRVGVLGWGIDTGLPISTVRATPVPMLGVILVATGHGGALHGPFYGLGVVLGVLAGMSKRTSGAAITVVMNDLQRRLRRWGQFRVMLAPTLLTGAALLSLWAIWP